MSQPVRIEHDLLGDRAVPADVYYGIHTLRALENFSITGTPISHYPELINALACVKQAAAIASVEFGLLHDERSVAIRLACAARRSARAGCTRSLWSTTEAISSHTRIAEKR